MDITGFARAGGAIQSTAVHTLLRLKARFVLVALLVCALFPISAQAHTGPPNPVASSYVAKLTGVPAGLEAHVVGGDLKMWLRVDPRETVTVLDYQGAPYLRFSASGVDVNKNSAMYYLNSLPTPLKPPSRLTPKTPPSWERVSSGHEYEWHDGRLHALAAVALAPGQTTVGSWRIPLLVAGGTTSITGVLFHADDPSIVWFWPIAVVLLCLWAGGRLGRRRLDQVIARALSLAALAGMTLLAVGHELYGEPFVSTGQEILLALDLAVVACMLVALVWKGPGPISLVVIMVASFWAALNGFPTLLHGFVLMTVPAFVARAATVTCLSCGVALIVLLFGFRLADTPEEYDQTGQPEPEVAIAEHWESFA